MSDALNTVQNNTGSEFTAENFKKKAYENGWKPGRDDVILDILLEPFKMFDTGTGVGRSDRRYYEDFLRKHILEKKVDESEYNDYRMQVIVDAKEELRNERYRTWRSSLYDHGDTTEELRNYENRLEKRKKLLDQAKDQGWGKDYRDLLGLAYDAGFKRDGSKIPEIHKIVNDSFYCESDKERVDLLKDLEKAIGNIPKNEATASQNTYTGTLSKTLEKIRFSEERNAYEKKALQNWGPSGSRIAPEVLFTAGEGLPEDHPYKAFLNNFALAYNPRVPDWKDRKIDNSFVIHDLLGDAEKLLREMEQTKAVKSALESVERTRKKFFEYSGFVSVDTTVQKDLLKIVAAERTVHGKEDDPLYQAVLNDVEALSRVKLVRLFSSNGKEFSDLYSKVLDRMSDYLENADPGNKRCAGLMKIMGILDPFRAARFEAKYEPLIHPIPEELRSFTGTAPEKDPEASLNGLSGFVDTALNGDIIKVKTVEDLDKAVSSLEQKFGSWGASERQQLLTARQENRITEKQYNTATTAGGTCYETFERPAALINDKLIKPLRDLRDRAQQRHSAENPDLDHEDASDIEKTLKDIADSFQAELGEMNQLFFAELSRRGGELSADSLAKAQPENPVRQENHVQAENPAQPENPVRQEENVNAGSRFGTMEDIDAVISESEETRTGIITGLNDRATTLYKDNVEAEFLDHKDDGFMEDASESLDEFDSQKDRLPGIIKADTEFVAAKLRKQLEFNRKLLNDINTLDTIMEECEGDEETLRNISIVRDQLQEKRQVENIHLRDLTAGLNSRLDHQDIDQKLYDDLISMLDKKDYNGIAQTMAEKYDSIKDGDSLRLTNTFDAFYFTFTDETSKNIFPGKEEQFRELFTAFGRQRAEAKYRIGQEVLALEKQIRDGKIAHTQSIRNNEDAIKILAESFVKQHSQNTKYYKGIEFFYSNLQVSLRRDETILMANYMEAGEVEFSNTVKDLNRAQIKSVMDLGSPNSDLNRTRKYGFNLNPDGGKEGQDLFILTDERKLIDELQGDGGRTLEGAERDNAIRELRTKEKLYSDLMAETKEIVKAATKLKERMDVVLEGKDVENVPQLKAMRDDLDDLIRIGNGNISYSRLVETLNDLKRQSHDFLETRQHFSLSPGFRKRNAFYKTLEDFTRENVDSLSAVIHDKKYGPYERERSISEAAAEYSGANDKLKTLEQRSAAERRNESAHELSFGDLQGKFGKGNNNPINDPVPRRRAAAKEYPVEKQTITFWQAKIEQATQAESMGRNSGYFKAVQHKLRDCFDAAQYLYENQNRKNPKAGFDRARAYADYEKAVIDLQKAAGDYIDYKMSDHTDNVKKNPHKAALNSTDKGKLKLMNDLRSEKSYFLNKTAVKKEQIRIEKDQEPIK